MAKWNFPLLFLTLLMFQLEFSYPMEYEDLQNLNATCNPQDTCSSSRAESEDNLVFNHCECGPHCVRYRTCCVDSPNLVWHRQYWRAKRHHVNVVECLPLFGTTRKVYGVSQCPPNWYGEDIIKAMCEDQEPDFGDPVAWMPTTNRRTGITYKNYFCAICNYESNNLMMWAIKIQSNSLNNTVTEKERQTFFRDLYFDQFTKLWYSELDDGISAKIDLSYEMPKELASVVRYCAPGVVSDCDPTWRNKTIKEMCLSYMALIYVDKQFNETYTTKVRYRNIHCAMCNFADFTSNTCALSAHTPYSYTPPMSFNLVLDFNPADGENVGEVEKKCGPQQVYDPFYDKCRKFKCDPGDVIKDGNCVKP